MFVLFFGLCDTQALYMQIVYSHNECFGIV